VPPKPRPSPRASRVAPRVTGSDSQRCSGSSWGLWGGGIVAVAVAVTAAVAFAFLYFFPFFFNLNKLCKLIYKGTKSI